MTFAVYGDRQNTLKVNMSCDNAHEIPHEILKSSKSVLEH